MDHQRPRILIVDDQISIRRTMTGIIEDWGCGVVDAEDAFPEFLARKGRS